MLELLYGSPGSGKTTAVLERLAADGEAGRAALLIVPEQQVVQTERLAAGAVTGEAALHIEVLSFRRLCNSVFRQYGGLCYHYLDEGGKLLLLYQVLDTLRDRLVAYGKTTLRDHRVIGLLGRRLSALSRASVTPAQLFRAAESEALQGERDRNLRGKLQDLGWLMTGMTQAMGDRFDDPEEDIGRLTALLQEEASDFFTGKAVYFDGFSDLTGQEYELVSAILRRAERVMVTVCMRPEDDRELLDKIRRHGKKLKRLAEEAAVPVSERVLPDRTDRPAALRQLERYFFGAEQAEPLPADGCVQVISCSDPYAEVSATAEEILRDVMQGGKFRDHAVATRDVGVYAPILESVFAARGIPVFLSRRGELTCHAAVRAIFLALEVLRGGWQTEDMLRYVETGYGAATLGEEDIYRYTQYVRSWSVRGKRFYDEYGFTMNPGGYRERFREEDVLLLQRLNRIRFTLAAPLLKLQEAFAGGERKHTAGELTEALYTFLCEIGMREKLQREAEEARLEGRTEDAERLSQLWRLIGDVLDTVHETAETLPCGIQLFGQMLQTAFESKDVGSIPTSLDEVLFSDALLLRGNAIRTLHLLGVNEGVFPKPPKKDDVFTDADLKKLEGLKPPLELGEDSLRAAGEELHTFYLCLALPRERLRLSYSRNDLKGSALLPADALEQISRIVAVIPDRWEDLPAEERIYSEAAAVEELPRSDAETAMGKALREILAAIFPYENGVEATGSETIGGEAAGKLFGEGISLTPSRLERFVNCPFSYHMKYTLRLSEERSGEPGASDRGTIVHLLLERFLRKMKEENRFDGGEPITDEEIEELTGAILREYAEEVCGGGEPEVPFARLLRQTKKLGSLLLRDLRDEFTAGKFRPLFFELPIGSPHRDAVPPDGFCLPEIALEMTDGGRVTVSGNIDRVDGYPGTDGYYLRVVDYKTYGKKLRTEDVELHRNLQMLLYLVALCRSGQSELAVRLGISPEEKPLPAGTLYYIAKHTPSEYTPGVDPLATAKKNLQRAGLLVATEELREATDPQNTGRFFPKKGGLSPEEFAAQLMATEEGVRMVAEDMKSGRADALPLKDGQEDGCQYCPMNPICRRKNLPGEGGNEEGSESGEEANG